MNAKKRLVLVDDHALFRAALRALLQLDPGIEVVGETGNGRDAVWVVAQHAPDLVLMDVSMPGMNGIEAVAEIKRRHPQVRVLMVTLHRGVRQIHAALKAGADGYILKDAMPDEFRLAVRSLLEGRTYLGSEVSDKVVGGFLYADTADDDGSYESLTLRERQVLKLVAEGNSNRAIAEYISLSVKTVEKHRANLMGKLDLHSASALTAYAIGQGLTCHAIDRAERARAAV